MLTQCPHCQTIFRVTQEVLTVADGQVRCGRCGAPFDGIKGFVDHHQLLAARRSSPKGSATSPTETTAEAKAARPVHNEPAKFSLKQPAAKESPKETASKSKGNEPDTIAPSLVAAVAVEPEPAPADSAAASAAPSLPSGPIPPKPVIAQPPAATKAAAPDEVAKDMTTDTMELVLRPPKKTDWGAWKFVVPPLLVLLGVQIVHYFRQDIANHPRFGPPLIDLYTELGVYLAPQWRLKEYEVRQLGVLANPGKPGTLRVRATITNRAKFAQPYPLLRLVLEDRFGGQVQAREFEPGEYAEGKFDGKARLLPNQRIDASLTIVDPGTQAEGFRFDVCLRQPAGVFCADDEPPVL